MKTVVSLWTGHRVPVRTPQPCRWEYITIATVMSQLTWMDPTSFRPHCWTSGLRVLHSPTRRRRHTERRVKRKDEQKSVVLVLWGGFQEIHRFSKHDSLPVEKKNGLKGGEEFKAPDGNSDRMMEPSDYVPWFVNLCYKLLCVHTQWNLRKK